MNRVKLFLTASAILAVVSSALAFTKFTAGSVYCFNPNTVVNQSASCALQAFTTHPHLKVDGSGSVTVACNGTDVAYDNLTGDCLPPTVQKFSSTGAE